MMTQHSRRWRLSFGIIFMLALAALIYVAGQLGAGHAPAPAGFLAADKGYGVTIDLTQYDDRALIETLAGLRAHGLLWLRQPIFWDNIEAEPGQFNWEALDRILAAIEQNNLEAARQEGETVQAFELIAVLHRTPRWARPTHTPVASPPTEVSDFGNFARALAERFGSQLRYYQIWHEPNLSANWGYTFVDPPAYAKLLRDAALNIRSIDADALILTAALAPTLENDPLNLNEMEYLNHLYWIKANRWFDIVAGQAYGFDFDPADPARADTLNFKRLELLHQVMLNYGDAATPIWATAFGWNALSATWSGRPSPWRHDQSRYDAPEVQAQRTAAALKQARQQWPWLGPILAVRWDSRQLSPDDPARGFALSETPLQDVFEAMAAAGPVATIGHYPANHASGRYSPGWRTALTMADIPRHEPRSLRISFEGTRLDLSVNRGIYRGYLWVTIDGQPANMLPQDSQGRSYLVLYDPLRESETVTLAQNLGPGRHEALIEAEGGWGQWAISGWTVSNEAGHPLAPAGLMLAGLVALLSGLGLVWQFFPALATATQQVRAWPGWAKLAALRYTLPGDTAQTISAFILAIAFYLAPEGVALVLLLPLSLVMLYRPDLGLALIAFSLSFFQAPKQLPMGPFLLTETTLMLAAAGFGLRGLAFLFGGHLAPGQASNVAAKLRATLQSLKSMDWAALALLALGLVSTLAAPNFGVSMFEWRMLLLGSVAYYFLIRLGYDYGPSLPPEALEGGEVEQGPPDPPVQGRTGISYEREFGVESSQPPSPQLSPTGRGSFASPPLGGIEGGLAIPPLRWAWRLIDAFVAGAVLHSAIVLGRYFLADQFVVAEGVRRALSPVYASPNNLSLFLDRVWPILLAVTVLPRPAATRLDIRRWLYGGGLIVVSAALYLTFSKGALLLGLPAGVVAMTLFHLLRDNTHRRRMIGITVGSLGVIALALIPLSQTTRFRTMFDFNQGSTGFFRLKLWQASLNMLHDYWPLGVGLNNFLYQYRTRYILPEAWQEPDLSHPHNIILDYGTQLGFGGVVILFWLQGAFWLNAWQLYQKLPEPLVLGLMGSMVVFLCHGLIDNSYFLVDLAFIFFLTAGLVQGLAGQQK